MHEKCFSVKAFPILSRCKEYWKQELRAPHLSLVTYLYLHSLVPRPGNKAITSTDCIITADMMVTEIRPFGNFLKSSEWLTGTSLCTNFAT